MSEETIGTSSGKPLRLVQWVRRSLVPTGRFLRELFRSPQSAIGVMIVLFFLILALFDTQIAPYGENESFDEAGNFLPVRTRPTSDLGQIVTAIRRDPRAVFDGDTYSLGAFPFGTDDQGRDVYSRVVLGAKSIFRVAGFGTLIAVVLGTALGLFIGYQDGWIDEIVSRVIDAMLAMPALLIALVILGIVKNIEFDPCHWGAAWDRWGWSIFKEAVEKPEFGRCLVQTQLADNSVLVVIALVYVPIVARVVRSSALEIKTREFVQAAQLRGESRLYIIFREIFPSVVPTLVVEASLRFSYAIFLVASLGFLGVGVPPPTPDWGKMVRDGRNWYDVGPVSAPWMLEYPAAAIAILVIGVNLMSDGIKRAVQKSG